MCSRLRRFDRAPGHGGVTLLRTRRSMPAMPIARIGRAANRRRKSSRRAARRATNHPSAAIPNRSRKAVGVITASRKMIVRPASKMLSAISFRRSLPGRVGRPSTNAIILSRKVSPGFDVNADLKSGSESTRVPPVTARTVAASFANHRRGFSGDTIRRPEATPFDDLAIAGD